MGVFYRQREGFFLLSFAMDCTFNRSYVIYLSIFLFHARLLVAALDIGL